MPRVIGRFLFTVISRIGTVVVASIIAIAPLAALPVVSEFMALNQSVLTDEDGDYSDWIEIHNPTSSPIDLEGWHLTDRADNPTLWSFPAVTLQPGAHLIVFASSKNRGLPGQPLHTNFSLAAAGEYLALIAPDGVTPSTEFAPTYPPQIADISYGTSTSSSQWVRLLGKSDPVRVLVPTETTGPALGTSWRERTFDDSSWTTGTLAVGFKVGTTDPSGMRPIFETDVQAQMYNLPSRQSVYLRVPFQINSPSSIVSLELRSQFDDGYAAFLNGGENPVDSANAPVSLAWNSASTATVVDGNGLPLRTTDLSNQRNRLVAGENILAIHGLNANQGSSDLLIAPQLWALVPSAATPGRTGYFITATPGAANPGEDGLTILETVTYSHPPRTFTGTLTVALSGAAANQTIRYTTDGSIPTASSPAYTAPLNLGASTTLRARVFDSAGVGGMTHSSHYLRLSSSLANRRSNLPMVILDARGQTLSDINRVDGFFHLFERDVSGISDLSRMTNVATRQGIRIRGSSSQGQPKRPYSVEFWDESNQDRRLEVLGMTSEADWIFYAPYNFDRAYTRNSVAYELSRRIGRWAPNTRFVEVFFNANGADLVDSDYAGVYAIVEQVQMNTRRLGHRLVTPQDIPPPGAINVNASGPWTGGYLYKIDRSDADEYNWTSPSGAPYTINRPTLREFDGGPYADNASAFQRSRQLAYIRTYVDNFETTLNNNRLGGFSSRSYLNHIDRDSFVDHLLINAFTKNVDALRLSAFFQKPENQKIHAGPVWDFDRSMDSYDGRDDATNTWYGSGDATQYFNYTFWTWLSQDPDFAQAFYDRWAVLRTGPLSDAGLEDIILPMGTEINNSANGLGSAAQRDATRWSLNTPRAGGYTAEISHLLNWMKNRAAWMDRRAIDSNLLPAPPTVASSTTSITISGTGTLYYTLDGSDPRTSGGTPVGQIYSGSIPINGPLVLNVRNRVGNVWSTPVIRYFNTAPPGPLFLPHSTADWTTNSHWENNPAPFPNGPAASATIRPPLGGSRNIDLAAPVTIGRISFPQDDSMDRNRIRGQAAGNTLTFNNGDAPARIDVGGTGSGFVEFEVNGGVILQSSLELHVTNLAGDSENGALRLRQAWSGPGGLIKTGPGIASLTGDAKRYAGPTSIEQGVLQITEPATMTHSASVTVGNGGQLRLVSGSSPSGPRAHTFGGDLFLSGSGRGNEVPDAPGLGRLGALRYDPGSQGNHASVTNSIELTSAATIHVNSSSNRLDLTGALRGDGSLVKSGGGTLGIIGNHSTHSAPVSVANGKLLLRGALGSPIQLASTTTFDAAGSSGPLTGSGQLLLAGTTLTTPQVSPVNHSLVFSQTAPPNPADPAASGNPLLVSQNVSTPLGIDLYLDLAGPITAETLVQGGFLLPAGSHWASILDHPGRRIFTADPAGTHEFEGKTWSPLPGAILTSVPTTLTGPSGPVEGRIMEIRFDAAILAYQAWRSAFFTPADAADETVSGPDATPFGDGIANLLRFALAIGETDSPARLPTITIQPDGTAFRFPYDPRLRGIRWQVEATADLTDWSDADILFDSHLHLDLPDAEGWLTVTDDSEAERRFFRLRVATDSSS
jgi:autotransporter-associated beta strand protein